MWGRQLQAQLGADFSVILTCSLRPIAEEGVVKPYKISVEGQEDFSFLALLLPAQLPEGRESDAGPSECALHACPWIAFVSRYET